jgi:hypothetical protein
MLSSSLEHLSFHYACQLQVDWDGRTAMISKTKLLGGVEDVCVIDSVSPMIYAMDFKESYVGFVRGENRSWKENTGRKDLAG